MDLPQRALNELADLERNAKAELKSAASPPPSPEQTMGLAFSPGDQVWDLVTGQKGEIIRGSTAHYVVPPPAGGKG
jgi:hypothetical protein